MLLPFLDQAYQIHWEHRRKTQKSPHFFSTVLCKSKQKKEGAVHFATASPRSVKVEPQAGIQARPAYPSLGYFRKSVYAS